MPKQSLPRTLEPSEVEAIFDAVHTRHSSQLRNYLVMRVMYDAGLRVGEACCLRYAKVRVVNWDTGQCEVTTPSEGKSGERVVPFRSPAFVLAWSRWLKVRPECEWAFPTGNRTAPAPQAIRRALGGYVRRAGLSKRVTPHMFRHTAATERIRKGWTVADVSAWLGHADVSTTGIYLHSEPERLRRLAEEW